MLKIALLKLTNNSSSLKKGHHDRDGVWVSDLNQYKVLRFSFSVFSIVLVSIELIYEILESLTTFANISKFIKNIQLCVLFLTLFSVFGNVYFKKFSLHSHYPATGSNLWCHTTLNCSQEL